MNTQHLEEFLILARELNCTIAAQQAFVARATLIEHMGELESELGCRLFARNEGRYRLTPIGRRFVRTASGMLENVKTVCDEYRDLAGNFLSVRIAATNLPWLETLVHRARKALAAENPRIVIEITPMPGASSTLEALSDDDNDIVVCGRKHWDGDVTSESIPCGFDGFKISEETIELWVTEGNPLFERACIRARDLDGCTLLLPPDIYAGYVRDGVADRFAERGAHVTLRSMPPGDHFDYFANGFDADVRVVPTTLKPRFGLDRREECRTFNLVDLPFVTDFYAIYRSALLSDPLARKLVETMRSLAQEDDRKRRARASA